MSDALNVIFYSPWTFLGTLLLILVGLSALGIVAGVVIDHWKERP